MEIATLESILACYNPICNADSMHVVPKREPRSPTVPFTRGKTVQSMIRPQPLGQESSLTTFNQVSLLALQAHFRTMGMNQVNKCLRMHHKSMPSSFHTSCYQYKSHHVKSQVHLIQSK